MQLILGNWWQISCSTNFCQFVLWNDQLAFWYDVLLGIIYQLRNVVMIRSVINQSGDDLMITVSKKNSNFVSLSVWIERKIKCRGVE